MTSFRWTIREADPQCPNPCCFGLSDAVRSHCFPSPDKSNRTRLRIRDVGVSRRWASVSAIWRHLGIPALDAVAVGAHHVPRNPQAASAATPATVEGPRTLTNPEALLVETKRESKRKEEEKITMRAWCLALSRTPRQPSFTADACSHGRGSCVSPVRIPNLSSRNCTSISLIPYFVLQASLNFFLTSLGPRGPQRSGDFFSNLASSQIWAKP